MPPNDMSPIFVKKKKKNHIEPKGSIPYPLLLVCPFLFKILILKL